jgi:hypothetical protein
MSEKLSNIELAYVATFGTLWGVSEITLGFTLHNLHVPFTGLIQTFIGTVIALITVKLTNRKRALIYTAMIAAVQKMLSFTTIKIFPFIGILVSAAVGQSVISVLGINMISFVVAGALMCGWPFAQGLLFYFLAYSPRFLGIYQDFFNKIHLQNINIWTLVKVIFIIHFFIGAFAALLAWKISLSIKKRKQEEQHAQ